MFQWVKFKSKRKVTQRIIWKSKCRKNKNKRWVLFVNRNVDLFLFQSEKKKKMKRSWSTKCILIMGRWWSSYHRPDVVIPASQCKQLAIFQRKANGENLSPCCPDYQINLNLRNSVQKEQWGQHKTSNSNLLRKPLKIIFFSPADGPNDVIRWSLKKGRKEYLQVRKRNERINYGSEILIK